MNKTIDAGELCGHDVFSIRADESLEDVILRAKLIGADLLLLTD